MVKTSDPLKGTVVYNNNGTFTYTPHAGAEGPDSFTYKITDKDGDTSTATVTINLADDFKPIVTSATDAVVVDEDGLSGANVDESPLGATETNSTESATSTGSITVQYGNDVPADLLGAIKLSDSGSATRSTHWAATSPGCCRTATIR